MKIAYLLPIYPEVSMVPMRREIVAMEELGVPMERFALRWTSDQLVDVVDRREQARTRAIISVGALGMIGAMLRTAITRPGRFFRAFGEAIRMGRKSEKGLLRNLIYFAEACVFLGWMKQGGFTHVHCHFATNATLVAMLCRIMGGPPYSFTMHGPEEFDAPRPLGLKEKIRHADFVVAITDFTRSQLYRWADYADWGKIRIVRCGVDRMFLDAEKTPVPDVPRLINIGRIVEQKGQLLLIQAAAKVIREGIECELVIVGDGPMRGEAQRLIDEYGIGDRVRITGYKSGPEVREEIRQSRALVLPSFAEGLPVVIFESLAMGRPVISTYIAGIPELVENGRCGWMVPAGSVDALARAMREALSTPVEEMDRMGREGARRVAEFHDARVEAARLASWFDHDAPASLTDDRRVEPADAVATTRG
ncbi:glycosyltransferase family 4 protein (plasmid) [Tundrisphaera sp. TA3]|uniref:glycosyltransferase family 4 protein n=1 Tax=Tundrisphaera sp. TA3 TaxID=3435775 RepID=UPI003EBAB530